MTFKPLTENRGEELLTLYLAGFHAKTSVQPEKAQELTESEAECGEKWQGSFTKYDRDSCSWKTAQCLLLGGLDEFSETWPRWGLMRDGECWERQTSALRIKETGSGLSQNKWATPTTMDKLPPKSEQALHKEATQARKGRSKPANLRDQVCNQHMWPTPQTRDYRSGDLPDSQRAQRKRAQGWSPNLNDVVLWPTPTAHNAKETNAPSESKRNTPTLGAQAGGALNPTWVEWLMGWPLGWTDLKPLAMGKSHCVQQQHGES
jgi:hypothetical protein